MIRVIRWIYKHSTNISKIQEYNSAEFLNTSVSMRDVMREKFMNFYACFLMIPTYVATLWMYQILSLFLFLTSHFKPFIHRLITLIHKWDEFVINFLSYREIFSLLSFPFVFDILYHTICWYSWYSFYVLVVYEKLNGSSLFASSQNLFDDLENFSQSFTSTFSFFLKFTNDFLSNSFYLQ